VSLLGIQLCAFPEQCVHLIEKQSLNFIRILPASLVRCMLTLVSIDDSHKIIVKNPLNVLLLFQMFYT